MSRGGKLFPPLPHIPIPGENITRSSFRTAGEFREKLMELAKWTRITVDNPMSLALDNRGRTADGLQLSLDSLISLIGGIMPDALPFVCSVFGLHSEQFANLIATGEELLEIVISLFNNLLTVGSHRFKTLSLLINPATGVVERCRRAAGWVAPNVLFEACMARGKEQGLRFHHATVVGSEYLFTLAEPEPLALESTDHRDRPVYPGVAIGDCLAFSLTCGFVRALVLAPTVQTVVIRTRETDDRHTGAIERAVQNFNLRASPQFRIEKARQIQLTRDREVVPAGRGVTPKERMLLRRRLNRLLPCWWAHRLSYRILSQNPEILSTNQAKLSLTPYPHKIRAWDLTTSLAEAANDHTLTCRGSHRIEAASYCFLRWCSDRDQEDQGFR